LSLEHIYFLTQIVSAAAIVLSLVFVGYQLRESARATRAQIHQNIAAGWQSVGPLLTDNAAVFAEGISATEQSFAAMTNADKLTFMSTIFVFFKHYENMFVQHREGVIDSEDWDAWVTHIFMYWHMPGVQIWWRMRRETFAPSFRHFLESSQRPTMLAQTDVFSSPMTVTKDNSPPAATLTT
jgi:hypothetical protein